MSPCDATDYASCHVASSAAFSFVQSAAALQAAFISYVSMTRPQRLQAADSTETMYHPILLIPSIPLPASQRPSVPAQACILSLSSAALCLTSDPVWRIRKCQWKQAGSGEVSVLRCWFLNSAADLLLSVHNPPHVFPVVAVVPTEPVHCSAGLSQGFCSVPPLGTPFKFRCVRHKRVETITANMRSQSSQ